LSIKGIVKGLLVGVVLTVLFLIILSVVSYFSDIPQEYLNIAMYICVAISVILGAVVCAGVSGEKILPNCIVTALLYILLLIIFSWVKNGGVIFNIHFFAMCAGVLLSSLAGAVIANKNSL